MKILSIDIETMPNLVYAWQMYGRGNDFIPTERLVEPTEMTCFSAKWVETKTDDTEPQFYSTYTHGRGGMMRAAFDLLDEADVLLHYNGTTFDEPKMNRELLVDGFWPPSPYKRIDLYRVVKTRFDFPSNKLNYVCKELGIGQKVEHNGFELWKQCMANDREAWAKMEEYNKQDVVLNEKLYRVMLPWIPNIPSYGSDTGEDCCPSCGSYDLVRQGFAYTKTGCFQRFTCSDCHSWSRSSHRLDHTEIVQCAV